MEERLTNNEFEGEVVFLSIPEIIEQCGLSKEEIEELKKLLNKEK